MTIYQQNTSRNLINMHFKYKQKFDQIFVNRNKSRIIPVNLKISIMYNIKAHHGHTEQMYSK